MISYNMTKKNIDYSKTIIYKIVCKDITIKDVYVGRTTNFTKRKAAHKNTCSCVSSKSYNLYVYEIIRLNGGWDNWDMIEIVKYPCNDTHDASKQERYYMEFLQATLNKVIPSRTMIEYREDNKNIIKEQHKEYWKKNNDKLKAYDKEYRANNIDKIKERAKVYYEKYKANNIDRIKAYSQEYRTKNKDEKLI
jgi:hypothetical protein